MKLLDSLFKIVHENELNSVYSFHISLDPNHITYEGHFPGSPITPGVVQIQIIEELLSYALKEEGFSLDSTIQCKFLKVIEPKKGMNLLVELSINTNDSVINVNSTFEEDGIVCFKFVGSFKKG